MSVQTKPGDSLDLRVFSLSMSVLCAVIAPLILFPQSGPAMINAAFSFATGKFGWLYSTIPEDDRAAFLAEAFMSARAEDWVERLQNAGIAAAICEKWDTTRIVSMSF